MSKNLTVPKEKLDELAGRVIILGAVMIWGIYAGINRLKQDDDK